MRELIIHIKNIKKKFIKNELFITIIKETIKDFFPKLNIEDINILEILTIFTVDFISFKYGFKNEEEYYLQWQQNNCSDIKGVILLLLPFIDDKNKNNLTDLNHILYSKSEKYIPKKILELNRDEILSSHFKYGNMGIGLLPFNDPSDNILLDLYKNDEKLIYIVIEENFYGLLQTLEIINGKSYINWINIQPLNLNNYHESNIYIKTNEYFNKYFKNPKYNKFLQTIDINYDGLWLGDFYNVIRNKYFEEGIKLKWLFFPYDLEPKSKYLIQLLNELINLEEIINNEYNDFNDLDEFEQSVFEKNIKNILITKLNSDINVSVISSTLYWLINNYKTDIDKNDENIKEFNINKNKNKNNEDDDEELGEDKESKDRNTVILGLKFILENHLNHLWNFLKDSIQKLIVSSYGKFLIEINDDNKYVIKTNYNYKPLNKNIKGIPEIKTLNIKNIYNIAKSLSHKGKTNKWMKLDKNYISLDKENRETFFYNIYENVGWFDINENYIREIKFNKLKSEQSFNLVTRDYENYIHNILNDFRNYFLIIVFEELVSSGILNKFVPNLQITDKTKLPQSTGALQRKRKSLIKELFTKNEKEWNESYYYLTNNKYKYINKMKIQKNKIINQYDKYEEKEYFKVISEDQEWVTFYAMNWISQISFFQHYIFHQVLYVTGATGQGKSTQVPKLLLYSTKMYDYNLKANIICTQPRKTPTIDNSIRIAEELGVPIDQVSNNSNIRIKTDNYYIQYKYEGGDHTKKNNNHSVLKIVTDGTLLELIRLNPTLKKNNKYNDNDEEKKEVNIKYNNNNYYDIIIIDEAHEHNVNMDIIIALAKQSCYINNQVKLIIVSATLDDDEPIYRSYFKFINDKLVFPIKSIIENPFFENKLLLLNPIYMDRRYHISPPGETTQYKITEVYLENDINLESDKENAKKAQLLGYDKVLEICNKSISGEILFFCTGKNEILEAVEYLNNNMPPGNIALPFFSEMNEIYKDIVTKINSKIYNIKNYRKNIHLEWNEKYVEDLSVPAGLYKRSVIIATNVAEASVNIQGLIYVIDNGYAKENIFNHQFSISKLEVNKISESSRIQRTGRIGRFSDGTIYYMYEKNARKDIKPKYNITQQDITENILSLSTSLDLKLYLNDPNGYRYYKLIASEYINPNLYQIRPESDSYNLYKPNTSFPEVSNLLNLYEKNYKINNDILKSDYFHYDNDNKYITIQQNLSLFVYNDGQLFSNLLDRFGLFYLIHPYEKIIKRNIVNKIINVDNNKKKTNYVPIHQYKYLLKSLINKNLIINLNANSLFVYHDDIINENYEYVKTELAEHIIKVKKDFELLNINEAITIMTASAMGCLNEVIEITTFLNLISNLPSNMISENIKWDRFRKIYKCPENDSDILFIYNIIKKIKLKFINEINKKINYNIDDEITKFRKLIKKSKEPPINYNGEQWNKLKNLKANGNLTHNKELFNDELFTRDLIFNDIENIRKEIEIWAENNYFNPIIIIQFVKKLKNINFKINKYNQNETIIWSKNFTSNFYRCLTNYNIEEKILRSFVYGNPTQYTINESESRVTNINFNLYNVNYILPYGSKTIDSIASVEDFIFYLNFKQTENLEDNLKPTFDISILNKIKPEWLIPALPLVHNKIFNDVSLNFNFTNNIDTIELLNSYSIKKLNKEFTNNWSNDYLVWNLSDENVAPIMHYFYKAIIKVINKLIR
jgi:hypothetical protein